MFKKLLKYLNPKQGLQDELDVANAVASIRKNIYFRGPNVYILAFAIIIASVGLNVNSIPVIIGAMLISPLMGPILGIGLALNTIDMSLLKTSLKNLGVMVAISIVASTLYFVLTPLRLENPTELLARTNPTIYDVIIALVGGLAGIVETCRKEKGTVLSGVAIATALMPPLCTIGYGISQLNWQYALGALYLFFINSVFIALATYLGAKYLGFEKMRYSDPAQQKRISRRITLGLIIIIIPSIISAVSIVKQSNFERSVSSFLENAKKVNLNYVLRYNITHHGKESIVELVVADTDIPSSDKETLYALAMEEGIARSRIAFIGTSERQNYSSNEMIEELFNKNELKLESRDSLIAQMQNELNDYRNIDSEYAKIVEEIKAQHPEVADVTIARVSSSKEEKSNQNIIVVIKSENQLSDKESQSLKKWLSVRMGGCEAKIFYE